MNGHRKIIKIIIIIIIIIIINKNMYGSISTRFLLSSVVKDRVVKICYLLFNCRQGDEDFYFVVL